MKNYLILALIFISNLAFAGQNEFSELPQAISCTSKSISPAVQNFEILNLNSKNPESTIIDSSLLETSVTNNYRLNVAFSNQCDNSYGITLFVKDLIALKEGRLNQINGLLNYTDVQLSELKNTDEPVEETVLITCTLK